MALTIELRDVDNEDVLGLDKGLQVASNELIGLTTGISSSSFNRRSGG